MVTIPNSEYSILLERSQALESLQFALALKNADYQIYQHRLWSTLYRKDTDWMPWADLVASGDPRCFVESSFEGQPKRVII